jgi:hypothetical protein
MINLKEIWLLFLSMFKKKQIMKQNTVNPVLKQRTPIGFDKVNPDTIDKSELVKNNRGSEPMGEPRYIRPKK